MIGLNFDHYPAEIRLESVHDLDGRGTGGGGDNPDGFRGLAIVSIAPMMHDDNTLHSKLFCNPADRTWRHSHAWAHANPLNLSGSSTSSLRSDHGRIIAGTRSESDRIVAVMLAAEIALNFDRNPVEI